jgi:chromate transporter
MEALPLLESIRENDPDDHVVDVAVAAGMIGATGLKLLSALKTNPLGIKVCSIMVILSFVGIAIVEWRLLYVLVILGGIGYVLAFLKLRDQA